jgi:hypothetical protein
VAWAHSSALTLCPQLTYVANALDSTTTMLRISDVFAVVSSMLIGCQSRYTLVLIRSECEISLDGLTSVQPLVLQNGVPTYSQHLLIQLGGCDNTPFVAPRSENIIQWEECYSPLGK